MTKRKKRRSKAVTNYHTYTNGNSFTTITNTVLLNDVATITAANNFAVGQTVVVTGCGDLNGTYTITTDSTNAYEFSVTVAEPDQVIYAVIPSGFATLSGASAAQLYANVAPIKNAILVVSVEVFQSITSPGNQIMGENALPQPFQLGRSLTNRVIGLLGPYLDVETMAQ